MSIIKFPSRKINKKKLITFISLCSILLIFIILSLIYFFNANFRRIVDTHILGKEIDSESLPEIEISDNEDQFFYAYDKYVSILNKNILYCYNSKGELTKQNDINISSPIFASNKNYLAIAEDNGNTIYLLDSTNISWQKNVDGNISNISINKNGYVSIILSGTSYKSIILLFDNKGNELFRTYLSSTMAIDVEISNDNKYLSVAEIDYSGSIIKSQVKNISMEKAKEDPTNSIIYTYSLPDNSLLTNIQYQDKNTLICCCNDGIYSLDLSNFSDNNILEFNDKYEFVDINLKNSILYTENNSFAFSTTSIVNILNIQNNSINQYKFDGNIKSVYCNQEKIAINTGSDIHFINLSGWLIKKYTSYSEINNLLVGDSIACIVSKNKIKIIEI